MPLYLTHASFEEQTMFYYFFWVVYVFICMCTCYGMGVEVRQLSGVGPLLLCRFWVSSSVCEALWHLPLPAEPSCGPLCTFCSRSCQLSRREASEFCSAKLRLTLLVDWAELDAGRQRQKQKVLVSALGEFRLSSLQGKMWSQIATTGSSEYQGSQDVPTHYYQRSSPNGRACLQQGEMRRWYLRCLFQFVFPPGVSEQLLCSDCSWYPLCRKKSQWHVRTEV